MGFWNQRVAGCLGGSVFSGTFNDSLNNRGQGWRTSNTLTVTGLAPGATETLRITASGANRGALVNGVHNAVSYNGTTWEALIDVENGDTVALRAVSNVQGGTVNTLNASICSDNILYTVSTKDYGANNCTGLASPRTCTGSVIQTFIGGAGSAAYQVGGCLDWAQEYGTGAPCVQAIGSDCFVYNGSRTTGSGQASDCGT